MTETAQPSDDVEHRIAVVVHPNLAAGEVANIVGILVGGLTCEAFGKPIGDADGHPHAAVHCNLIVLRAPSGAQLIKLLRTASEGSVRRVAFCRYGQQLSDNFPTYAAHIRTHSTADLSAVGVALYGPRDIIRSLTQRFSVYR